MTLSVRGLTTSFPLGSRRVPVVDDVSFEVGEGRCVALVGESGSGKSMTALSILRLVPKPGVHEFGQILLDGEDLAKAKRERMRSLRGATLSMIFQEPMTALNPVLRVGEQVAEVLTLRGGISREDARHRVVEMFTKVRIPDASARYDAYPHQLSGGLKQRVVIAMALIASPKVVIADEPTTALDVTIQAQILELLRELLASMKTSVVLITHDLGVVNQLADEVLVMYAGRIVERGPREILLKRPSHPYTEGLLRALPSEETRGGRLFEIPGAVPSPDRWPTGCRFHPRCPLAEARCAESLPPVTENGNASFSCHVRGGAR